MVICLERGADLHMAQLMPLTLTVSCFSKIQIGFSFVVPAHLGSPGKKAVKRVCVTIPCNLSLVACFLTLMLVTQGNVATYARCGGILNSPNHFTANLLENFPVKEL